MAEAFRFVSASAHGAISPSNGGVLSCAFVVEQRHNGQIVVRCDVEPQGLDGPRALGGKASVEGETISGERIVVNDALVVSEQLNFGHQSVKVRLSAREAAIHGPGGPGVAVRYGLTNLKELRGNEAYRLDLPNGGVFMGRQSRFQVDGHDVVVRHLENARDIIGELKATRSVSVTAEATIAGAADRFEALEATLEALCLLLTLGQGCLVSFIYREALDADGRVVETQLRNAVTKAFGTLDLVPAERIHDFVTATYPRLAQAKAKWGLRDAILGYNDAKAEGDYLELRAVKMVVAMEHVRARYLESIDGEWLIPEREFDDKLGDLRKLMGAALEVLFSARAKHLLNRLLDNLKCLDRPSFRSVLSGMCRDLGIQLEPQERGRIVDIRNSLVHRAAFLQDGTPPWDQYRFLMVVLGKLLLAILGYRGDYYDWTKEPNSPEFVARLAPSKPRETSSEVMEVQRRRNRAQ